LVHARELGHPQTSVVAEHFAAQLHQLRGEISLAHAGAKEMVQLADEYGLELWLAFGNINLGWAEVELGQPAAGIERMQSGLSAYEKTGAKLWRPHFLGLLAAALAKVQKLNDAVRVAAEATTLAERSGEMYSLPELYRIRGQLLIAQAAGSQGNGSERFSLAGAKQRAKRREQGGSPELVQASQFLSKALTLARQQQAKAWELRTLVALTPFDEIQSSQGDSSQLADTYAWFTEGHDTMDLMRARVILERAHA
jgi:hypothetical protein